MTKNLRKAIMARSKLQNKYNKNRQPENWIRFKKQRNKCIKILRNVKNESLSNLKTNGVTNSKKFGQQFKQDSKKYYFK